MGTGETIMNYYDIYDDEDDILEANVPESEVASKMEMLGGTYFEPTLAKSTVDRKAFNDQAKVDMEANIQSARAEAIPQWQKNLMPYSSNEQIQSGDSDLFSMSTLKDAFSLPGRLLTTIGSPEWDTMAKTSEEYEGLGGKFLTSPVTGAVALTAPLAPIMGAMVPSSAPTWAPALATGATEGMIGSIAGATMDDTYGGSDAALDMGLSIVLPILGPVIKNLTKVKGKEQIAKILKDKGVKYSDFDIDEIYKVMSETPTLSKSVSSFVDGGIDNYKLMGIKDLGNRKKELFTELMVNSAEPRSFLDDVNIKQEVLEDIETSLGSGSSYGVKRSIADIDKDVGRVNEFFRKQELLKKGLSKEGYGGFLTDDEYKEQMIKLVSEYSDIPELFDMIQGSIQKKADDQDWLQLDRYIKQGDILSKGLKQSPSLSLEHPIASTLAKTGKGIQNNYLPLSGMASEGIRFLPQLTRDATEEEEVQPTMFDQGVVKKPQTKQPQKTQYGIGFKR